MFSRFLFFVSAIIVVTNLFAEVEVGPYTGTNYGVPSKEDGENYYYALTNSVNTTNVPEATESQFLVRPVNTSYPISSGPETESCSSNPHSCLAFQIYDSDTANRSKKIIFQKGDPSTTDTSTFIRMPMRVVSRSVSATQLDYNYVDATTGCLQQTGDNEICEFHVPVHRICDTFSTNPCVSPNLGGATSVYQSESATFYVGLDTSGDGYLTSTAGDTYEKIVVNFEYSNFTTTQGPTVIVKSGDKKLFVEVNDNNYLYTNGYKIFIREGNADFESGNSLEYIPYTLNAYNITDNGTYTSNQIITIDTIEDERGNKKNLENLKTYAVGAYYVTAGGNVAPKSATNNNSFGIPVRVTGALTSNKCFVATYLFGENHFVTTTLRYFRDHLLLKVPFGESLVTFYNNHHQEWIILAVKHKWFKILSTCLIFMISISLYLIPLFLSLVIIALIVKRVRSA